MIQSILLKIKLFSLFVFSLIFLASCASLTQDLLKDPKVTINSMAVNSVGLEDLALDLDLQVENPNPVPLVLNQINYSLSFSGETVTEGVFEKGVNIPASGSNSVVVPLKFKYSNIGNLLVGALKKSLNQDYELSGSAKIGIFSIPFAKKGEIKIK